MLHVGHLNASTCRGVSRRALLEAGSIAALGLSLPGLLRSQAGAAPPPARARSVILLWLWGGPSHLDTFDLKPGAPLEYRGPYRPIATNVPGIEICELLPKLARQADKYALIRSLNHHSNDHGIGGTIGLTGSSSGAVSLSGQVLPGRVQPAYGSVVSRLRESGSAPAGFVAVGGHLHQGHRRIEGEGAAVLGALYDPFRIDYDADEGVKVPQLELIDGVTREGLGDRRRLLASLDSLSRSLEADRRIETLDRFYQQAFSLLTSGAARRVFDIDEEPDDLRTRYGRFRFGQCCLLARRLVEAGVAFVQVNWSSHVEPLEDAGDGGWDTHDRNYPQLQDRHAWMLDQALSALLDDLAGRGLLESTAVVAVGEFGRTPKINAKAGRDHWQQCYSALVAGGGLPGGQVIGSSDRRGEYPASQPVEPGDLAMTLYHCLGMRTSDLTNVGLAPTGAVIEDLVS
jgi:hypothetical protein